MDEGVAAQLVSGADHQIATGNEVVVGGQVGSALNEGDVFVRLTGDAEDVRALLFDLTESLSGTGNSLVDDDGLHLRIIREVDDGLNGGLEFFGEVVGIDGQLDHILAVLRLESLRTAAVVLRLRNGTGHDTDMGAFVFLCSLTAGAKGDYHGQSKQQGKKLFHFFLLKVLAAFPVRSGSGTFSKRKRDPLPFANTICNRFFAVWCFPNRLGQYITFLPILQGLFPENTPVLAKIIPVFPCFRSFRSIFAFYASVCPVFSGQGAFTRTSTVPLRSVR